jgi:hypothetical protein
MSEAYIIDACRTPRGRRKGSLSEVHPIDLLSVDIFFDGVPVHGDLALADGIFDYAYEQAYTKPYLTMLMSGLGRDWRPPLTVFGGFRKDDQGRVDFKKHALLPIFTGVRTLAIKHGVRERSTAARLRAAPPGSRRNTSKPSSTRTGSFCVPCSSSNSSTASAACRSPMVSRSSACRRRAGGSCGTPSAS